MFSNFFLCSTNLSYSVCVLKESSFEICRKTINAMVRHRLTEESYTISKMLEATNTLAYFSTPSMTKMFKSMER